MSGAAALRIAPLAPGDHARWLPLWRAYQAFYRADIPEAASALTFQRLTGGAEPMGGFLAFLGDEAVGMTHWIAHRSCWTVGDYCYLQDLFVAPDRRGSGVARALIGAVEDVARARGCARVWWLTHETNAQAMALYDKVAARSGFVQYVKSLA